MKRPELPKIRLVKKAAQRAAWEIIVAAAETAVPRWPELKDGSCATWRYTRRDLREFDPVSTAAFLRREKCDPNEELLQAYASADRPLVDLRGISQLAPWIAVLEEKFSDYGSFHQVRSDARYSQILTFTAPVVSADGCFAFLEVWTENGRFAQAGSWKWGQLHRTGSQWSVQWMQPYALS